MLKKNDDTGGWKAEMPYSDCENVNILTALLVRYGVTHVVVCPGSRNAPLVHNFKVCPFIECHPVTDERSAGFVALGIAQAEVGPVAVCVTSGSALLNVLPAAAEATYQQKGIIVISADRPKAWIDQLDGQTIPQFGALGSFVGKSVDLPEPTNDEQRWHCRRLVGEAMMALNAPGHKSVHINVPISEPFFSFTTAELPDVQPIVYTREAEFFVEQFVKSKRPMIVLGQLGKESLLMSMPLFSNKNKVVVLAEKLSEGMLCYGDLDRTLYTIADDMAEYQPDFIIYMGGHIVSKRMRHFLRNAGKAEIWHVSECAEIHDVSMHMTGLLQVDHLNEFVEMLTDRLKKAKFDQKFVSRWNNALMGTMQDIEYKQPAYSQALAVKLFEEAVMNDASAVVFYANSSAVRLGNMFSEHKILCNRGINGIEGSLSTAVGYSLVVEDEVYCVIGDLSFFYDQNALWNNELICNMRILLLNNGGGGIFHQLPGLEASTARDEYVAAAHGFTAEGICKQYDVDYLKATDEDELTDGIGWLTEKRQSGLQRPRLLEVMTNVETDTAEFKKLYNNEI